MRLKALHAIVDNFILVMINGNLIFRNKEGVLVLVPVGTYLLQ